MAQILVPVDGQDRAVRGAHDMDSLSPAQVNATRTHRVGLAVTDDVHRRTGHVHHPPVLEHIRDY